MAEQEREALRRALARAIGEERADRLMEHLPPFPWDDVARQHDLIATRHDLERLREEVGDLRTEFATLRTEFATLGERLEHRFEASLHRELNAHARLMYFSMIGAIFTTASLAFAAARF